LGGSVKIAQELAVATSVEDLIAQVSSLPGIFEQKAFAVSAPSDFDELKPVANQLKQAVQAKGHRFRFRLLRDMRESSGILTQYQELIFIKADAKYYCLHTQAVQSLSKWTNKDFGRPQADPKVVCCRQKLPE
jgi:hypothetical protein